MKHKLTEEQLETLRKYFELINSDDDESVLLGIRLFYDEYKDFRCPYRKYKDQTYYTIFIQLQEPNYSLDWFYKRKIYWLERVVDLYSQGYYYK